MNLRGEKVLVIGLRQSGLAAIDLLLKQGADVRAMDEKPLPPAYRSQIESRGIPFSLQQEGIGAAELIVLSPGVPVDLPLLDEARANGVPVIGEVELASYYLKGSVIGITGSNGKTTTTALVGHLLKECGLAAQVGGNIGLAVTAMVDSSAERQWNVLELSSFQLETIQRFRAEIGACLNVTADHLDRHHTFDAYAAAKGRLFETQQQGDHAVLNFDDPTCSAFAKRTKAEVFWFSSSQRVPVGMWLERGQLVFNGKPFLERSRIRLRGLHNVENVMAGALTAVLAGAAWDQIAEAVTTFPGVEHRIEFVRSLHGVEYFNDSKATNVDATLKAIDAFPGHLWVILGGKDKGSDYRPLRDPLSKKARAALLIGEAAQKIGGQLEGALPLVSSGTMGEAVQYARAHAEPGDIVLLAPACASFDQFENYEHRGNVFKHIVSELF